MGQIISLTIYKFDSEKSYIKFITWQFFVENLNIIYNSWRLTFLDYIVFVELVVIFTDVDTRVFNFLFLQS